MNNNYESHAISRRSFLKASGVVGAAGILAACGGNSGSSSTAASSGATSAPNTTGATPLKEFISWESTNRELESWNMLYSQMASDMNVTTNLWEGLLSFDCYGKAVPSVAKEMGFDKEAYDGKTMIRLRANNGDIADLKKQAMDELGAVGVTFPVHAAYYIIAGSTTALDTATVLKQCFTDSFGDDFIVLDIKTYVSSLTQEVRNPQLQSFVINGWGADYGDPVNFVGQEILHDDNAYYSWYYSNIAKIVEAGPADWQKDLVACYEEFTDLVNTAKAIVDDTDARYAAFAKAEASMLNNVLACPCNFEVSWTLTHANEYSKINAVYGPCNYKAVNWETSEEAYTTAQYEEFAAAFDAATKA